MITDKQQIAQAAHLYNVPSYCRIEMRQYLDRQAPVRVCRQTDVPEAPPWAICVVGTEFWIECCKTKKEAIAFAESLGLPVVS